MSEGLYFTRPSDPNFQQAQVAISFLSLKTPTEQINKKYDPLVLLTPHGSLNQPNAILLYLVGDKLRGQDEEERIRIFEWFEYFNLELHPLLKEVNEQIAKERPVNRQKFQYAIKELTRVLDALNNHLKIRTFFVGDSLSVIDISLATHLNFAFKNVIHQEWRKKLPNLTRWFSFVRATGPFLSVLGAASFCGKASVEPVWEQKREQVII